MNVNTFLVKKRRKELILRSKVFNVKTRRHSRWSKPASFRVKKINFIKNESGAYLWWWRHTHFENVTLGKPGMNCRLRVLSAHLFLRTEARQIPQQKDNGYEAFPFSIFGSTLPVIFPFSNPIPHFTK